MIDRTMDLPSAWDEEVDVVIAGAGSAGLTCAVVAAVEGLSVLVLEKGGHGRRHDRRCPAVARGFQPTGILGEVGVEDSPEQALATYARVRARTPRMTFSLRWSSMARRRSSIWRTEPASSSARGHRSGDDRLSAVAPRSQARRAHARPRQVHRRRARRVGRRAFAPGRLGVADRQARLLRQATAHPASRARPRGSHAATPIGPG